jgi:hypothetical protein
MTTADIVRPLALAGTLLGRFWPQLLLIGSIGYIAHDLLLLAAVRVGHQNALGGMLVLSLVVLTKLLVVVLMFLVLHPGMPAVSALREQSRAATGNRSGRQDRVFALTAATVLPFFAYYAAWGFLGDTVREYSRLVVDEVRYGTAFNAFDLAHSSGFAISIVVCWAIRWFAKRMSARARVPYWRLLVVAADASWIFIGLYAIGIWKTDLIKWIGSEALLQRLSAVLPSLTMAAQAADRFTPVELRPVGFYEQAKALFFYALLPLVWLVMAAIINGYEVSPAAAAAPAGDTVHRKWLRDFVKHFIGGYRSRYRPVWTCLRLTLSAGLPTLLIFVIAYRALNWLGGWLWFAATRWIDVHGLDSWRLVADVIDVFIGSPSDLDGGILLDAVRIALLAGVLEYAVSTQRPVTATAAAT